MTRAVSLVAAGVAVLAGSAIGHATAGPPRAGAVVVSVEARGLRAATGFVVADGRVVTVAHAVGDGAIVVRGPGTGARRATVVRRDDELDLALLDVPGVEHEAQTSALGGPRVVVRRAGATSTVPVDVLRSIDARVRNAATDEFVERPAIEVAAPIRAGDSGAPVIGADGRVAGVVFARSRARVGIAYAVDATALAEVTELDGLPITTPARTLLDLAARLRGRRLEAAVDAAERKRRSTSPTCTNSSRATRDAPAHAPSKRCWRDTGPATLGVSSRR